MEHNEQIREIGPNAWIVPQVNAVFTQVGNTVKSPETGTNGGRKMAVRDDEGNAAEIWQWGENNLLPQKREELLLENNIAPELLKTKRDVALGAGLVFYREVFVNGEIQKEFVPAPAEVQAFIETITADPKSDYFMMAAGELCKHGGFPVEYIKTKEETGIASIKVHPCRHVRAGIHNRSTGMPDEYYLSANWEKKKDKRYKFVKVPRFQMDSKAPKGIDFIVDPLFFDDYYPTPAFWGGRKWIEMANKIPIFHIANIENGYLLRYHIEIPKDYFLDTAAFTQARNQEEKQSIRTKESEARRQFIKRVNQILAGENQAGRTLFTEYEINRQIGKDYPGIKITPIDTDIKDEALLKLFERSNDANMSGMGVHPAMAAIQTAGKLSSGSEIRNATSMFTAIKTPVMRRLILHPIMVAWRMNGWDPTIKVAFKDIEIKNLDENPTGRGAVMIE